MKARYVMAALLFALSVACIWTALDTTDRQIAYGHEPITANDPIGQGKGIHPGRVAWIHDANATNWPGSDGDTHQPYWHTNTCTDPNVVADMMSKALRALTGDANDVAAWDALFKNFNQQAGRGEVGYTPGEKIAIKVNFVLMITSGNGSKNKSNYDQIDNSPQLTIALLRQLIDKAGVAPEDISIGDPQNRMADYWYDMVHAECPGVVYLCKNGVKQSGRTPVSPDYSAPFYFSDPCSAHWNGVTRQDYIPDYFAQADYFINFPILKSHNSAGITVSKKNNYGSLMRAPNASGYYNMHNTRPYNSDNSPYSRPGMGYYRATVDLMGHPKLGGKTLLVLIDGLYGGRSWDSHPIRWEMAPFNGDWPSSLVLSQDQVAADSVAFDFMDNEWDDDAGTINGYPQYAGTDDYLHEAALIPNPPSGTIYDPNNDGGLTESLGVHEHWNNAEEKLYSRNIDPILGTGIELVTQPSLPADDPSASVIADGAELQRLATGFSFTEGPAADVAGNVFFTDQPNDKIMKWSTDGTLSVFLSPCGRSNGLYFDSEGNLWACADEHNELWRIDPQGHVTVVITDYKGKLLNGPNDLWITRINGIYLTDPYFRRSYWHRGPSQQNGQHVFYLAPDLQTLTQVTTDLQQPNGIVGTPDDRFLYVADYGAGRTYRYTIQPDGTLADKILFCTQGSDGMTLDEQGNVYLTGSGVTVYNRLGEKIETIHVPEGTSNVTFGGEDRKTLFITARTSLYTIRMRVRGASFSTDERDEYVESDPFEEFPRR